MDTEILERAEGLLSREKYTYNECADLMVKFAVAEVARREKEIGNDLFALPGDMSYVRGLWEYVQNLRAKSGREAIEILEERLDEKNLAEICPECHILVPDSTSWHIYTCSLRPRNQLLRQCEIYQNNSKAYQTLETRLKDLIAKWNGKFLIVKNENNKLRAKMWPLRDRSKQKLQQEIRELKAALNEASLTISVRTKQMDEDGYEINRMQTELRRVNERLNEAENIMATHPESLFVEAVKYYEKYYPLIDK